MGICGYKRTRQGAVKIFIHLSAGGRWFGHVLLFKNMPTSTMQNSMKQFVISGDILTNKKDRVTSITSLWSDSQLPSSALQRNTPWIVLLGIVQMHALCYNINPWLGRPAAGTDILLYVMYSNIYLVTALCHLHPEYSTAYPRWLR